MGQRDRRFPNAILGHPDGSLPKQKLHFRESAATWPNDPIGNTTAICGFPRQAAVTFNVTTHHENSLALGQDGGETNASRDLLSRGRAPVKLRGSLFVLGEHDVDSSILIRRQK